MIVISVICLKIQSALDIHGFEYLNPISEEPTNLGIHIHRE